MNQLLGQKRAAFALEFVVRFEGAESARKMATHINKTPIRILNHGLGQALAFLLSDNEGKKGVERKPSGLLYDALQEWLCGERDDDHPMRVYSRTDLIGQLLNGGRDEYLRAQAEALRLFDWLCKFAGAYLGAGEEQ